MDSLLHCYSIKPLGAEVGIWHEKVDNHNVTWLRWWDSNGGEKRANAGKYQADIEQQRAGAEKQRADRLTTKLKEIGIDLQYIGE